MEIVSSQYQKRQQLLKERTETKTGLAAIEHLHHGMEVTIELVTAIGQRMKTTTVFIGSNDQLNQLYFSLPEVTKKDLEEFFLQQVWVVVTATCGQGEGVMVRFKSRISHVLTQPLGLFVLPMPQQAQVCSLRDEVRYNFEALGYIKVADRQVEVRVQDLSANGCRISYGGIAPVLAIDENISLMVSHAFTKVQYKLSGLIKNQQRVRGQQQYGIQLDSEGAAQAKQLLAQLTFKGTKLSFIRRAQSEAESG